MELASEEQWHALWQENFLANFAAPIERRTKPRLFAHYPALVRGVDSTGHRFEDYGLVSNLSASGLYLRLWRCLELEAHVLVLCRLAPGPRVPGSCLAMRGLVGRIEPHQDGLCGLAIRLGAHRFL